MNTTFLFIYFSPKCNQRPINVPLCLFDLATLVFWPSVSAVEVELPNPTGATLSTILSCSFPAWWGVSGGGEGRQVVCLELF